MRTAVGSLFVVGLVALTVAGPSGAQDKAAERLGSVQFATSCAPTVQTSFNRAVALLHSFHLDAAVTAFTEVAGADPACGVAQWGIAMAWLGNPLAGPPSARGLKEGWAAVERAKAAGAKTPRERDYIAAIETFYKDTDKVDHRTRALAYEKAMEQISARYPADREAAVFYALALNITLDPNDKTYANQLKAAAILERVFAEQPNHPGVAHYLIHSYDFPPIAAKGLPAAKRYASIAPSAPHALHMPSHIFTRVGSWQESIDSNRASAKAAEDTLRSSQSQTGLRSYEGLHAYDYMMYGYLQLGRDREARALVEEVATTRKLNVDHFAGAFALAAIPARYALERGQWAEAATLSPTPADLAWNRFPQAESIVWFARGIGAARSADPARARGDLARIEALRDGLTAAKSLYWAHQSEVQRLAVAGWIARAEGRNEEALALMRASADAEDATEKHPVTPGSIKPARELLGEMLVELGQPAQALKEFEASHRVEPNRFQGLYGAARAAELTGDTTKARTYYGRLVTLGQGADPERPELKHAKTFIAAK
jgi:tetratricopeptide (TPR) repeat protein